MLLVLNFAGSGTVWAAIDITVGENTIDMINHSANSYRAGMRIWMPGSAGLPANYPFTTDGGVGSGSFEGKEFKEFWLTPYMQPLDAAGGVNDSVTYGLWSGKLSAGTTAEPLLKVGVCNEPLPRCDEEPISLGQLAGLLQNPGYYSTTYRYEGGDFLGKHGGLYSGSIFDSFCGETQFQFAVPTERWRNNCGPASCGDAYDMGFDANRGGSGPMFWMALSANQEYFGVDYQLLIAIGMKETNLMTTNNSFEVSVNIGNLTPFAIDQGYGTMNDLVPSFPLQYPFGISSGAYSVPDGLSYSRYVGDGGGMSGHTTDEWRDIMTEGPMAINGIFSAGIFWQMSYHLLASCSNLAFKQLLENSNTGGDRRIGFCLASLLYNKGYGTTSVYDQIDPNQSYLAGLMDNPHACQSVNSAISGNIGGYAGPVDTNAQVLERASLQSATNSSVKILERWITLADLQTFWFGEDAVGAPGTPQLPARDQFGGLLLHYDMTTAQRQALWDDLKAAFDLQAQHWGGGKISLRYDWLSNLRVGKSHIGRSIEPLPRSWMQNIVDARSNGVYDGSGKRVDGNFPFMSLAPIAASDAEGFAVEVHASDPRADKYDRGIKSVEWSLDPQWRSFSSGKVQLVGGLATDATYKIDLAKSDLAPLGDAGGDLYVRVTDSCGNAVMAQTKIIGMKLPKILRAYITDTDGDGNGDHIVVYTQQDADVTVTLASATALRYSWPATDPALPGDLGLVDVGQFTIVDNSLVGGAPDGLGGKVEIDLGSMTLRATIADSVGPVIRYAGVQETDPSVLFILFSEPVQALTDMVGSYIELNGQSLHITAVEQVDQIWKFTVATPFDISRLENLLDSVRIVPMAVRDLPGNGASQLNRKVPVLLDKGPLQLAQECCGYFDTDGDGTMDRIEIRFAQPAAGRTGTMTLKYRWPVAGSAINVQEFTIPGDQLTVDPVEPTTVSYDASGDNLRELSTYFDLTKSQWGWAHMDQTSATPAIPAGDDELPMTDRMGPVAVSATYGESRLPERLPDTLAVVFSEPVDTSAASLYSDRLYWVKTGNALPTRPRHQPPTEKNRVLMSGAKLLVYFQPEQTDRPGIGDSLRIVTELGEDGLLRDPSGNRAPVMNPWVLLRGKLRSQITSADQIYRVDGELADRDPLTYPGDTVMFFDYLTNLDSISRLQAGLGFTISFLDSAGDPDRTGQRFGYKMSFFSNLGGFVETESREFTCEDMQNGAQGGILATACDISRYPASRKVKVWVPWDYRTRSGRLVGSGAYIQKLQIWGSRIESLETTRTIGVLRSNNRGRN